MHVANPHHLQTPKMAISDDGKVSYTLEYRSKKDDAWYTSGVLLENRKQLRVKLENFEDSCNDEVFPIADFSSHHEINDFLRRFRPVSVPVEANECSGVMEGMKVCATYTGDDGSLRYFDAIVDAVRYKEHTPEKCLCTYLLVWQHGPDEGNVTAISIDGDHDICHIMSGALDPKVDDFVKLVREKLRGTSSQSGLISKTPFLSTKTCSNSNQSLNKLQDSSGDGDISYHGFSDGRERFDTELIDQDREMGGVKDTVSHHYIILENLEKDLSPISMAEFIHEQTSITAHAYVFQTLSTETYARGAIIVDSKPKIKRIYQFISNPNHFIVSKLSGRPWVIAEDMLRAGTFNISLHILQPKSENINMGNKLMVVRLGTDEYTRAKKSKDLYMEFRNHLNGLLKRLDMEEKKKWHPSSTN